MQLPVLDHDADEVRRRAGELLSRPPYRERAEGPVTDVLRRIRDVVAEALDRLLSPLAGNTAVAWTVAIGGTLLLLVLVWRWTRGVSGERRVAGAVPGVPRRRAADWEADAAAHVEASRWRDAVRCWYAATVAHLHEHGVVEEVPGRTVAELDAELRRTDPALSEPIAAAGRRFEDVWYGHLDADRADAEAVAALHRQVVSARPRSRDRALVGAAGTAPDGPGEGRP